LPAIALTAVIRHPVKISFFIFCLSLRPAFFGPSYGLTDYSPDYSAAAGFFA
jgi:hypothetical protein